MSAAPRRYPRRGRRSRPWPRRDSAARRLSPRLAQPAHGPGRSRRAGSFPRRARATGRHRSARLRGGRGLRGEGCRGGRGTLHTPTPALPDKQGGGTRGFDSSTNDFKCGGQIVLDHLRSQTNNSKSEFFQNFLANAICLYLQIMGRAIHFNNQTIIRIIEIDNERADRLLAAEFYSVQSSAAQSLPQNSFAFRRLFAKIAGDFNHPAPQRWRNFDAGKIGFGHTITLTPDPSPQRTADFPTRGERSRCPRESPFSMYGGRAGDGGQEGCRGGRGTSDF